MGDEEKPACKGCSDEKGEISIKLGDKRVIRLGPKCYEKAMRTSVWTVLEKPK